MTDGWYRIIYPGGFKRVEYIEKNSCQAGTVKRLREEYCLLEPVRVFTEEEFKAAVECAKD